MGQQVTFFVTEAGARVVVFANIDEETAKTSTEESKRHAIEKGLRNCPLQGELMSPTRRHERHD